MVNADRELFLAVEDDEPGRTSAWLAHGADANARDNEGKTPLFWAVYAWNHPEHASLLIAHGADVRPRDHEGQTPLHYAALFGSEAQIGLLLEHGAEIDARTALGRTPLHYAAGLGRHEEVALLVRQGADTGIRDNEGRTPLDLALKHGLMGDSPRESLAQLLGGFVVLKIIEARPDLLILRVGEDRYTRYTDAEREAQQRGTLVYGVRCLDDLPPPNSAGLIRCPKGLSSILDEAWKEARRQELGIRTVRSNHVEREQTPLGTQRGLKANSTSRRFSKPADTGTPKSRTSEPAREDSPMAEFVVVKVLQTERDSLIMQVETQHGTFREAQQEAWRPGSLAFPYRFGPDAPPVGELIRWPKGLSSIIDRAWRAQRRRELGISIARSDCFRGEPIDERRVPTRGIEQKM
jgi:hypothetical protein